MFRQRLYSGTPIRPSEVSMYPMDHWQTIGCGGLRCLSNQPCQRTHKLNDGIIEELVACGVHSLHTQHNHHSVPLLHPTVWQAKVDDGWDETIASRQHTTKATRWQTSAWPPEVEDDNVPNGSAIKCLRLKTVMHQMNQWVRDE